MRAIEASNLTSGLSLNLIEASDILPFDTAYFSEPMPAASAPARQRATERAAWFGRAQKAMGGCDLVFLDPDNGLAVKSVPLTSPSADKYVTVQEIAALMRSGAAVVLYQHGNRTPWSVQRQHVCAEIVSATGQPVGIRTVRFGAFGVRAFFCLAISPRQASIVERGLAMLDTRRNGWAKAPYLLIE